TVTVTLSVDSRASTSTATTVEQRRRNLRISPRIRIGVLAHAEDCARVARSTDVRRRPRLESTGSPPLSRADDEEERINDASTMVKWPEHMSMGLPVVAFDLRKRRHGRGLGGQTDFAPPFGPGRSDRHWCRPDERSHG